MTFSKTLLWEGTAFLSLLVATVAYRLLTRQIRMGGLLLRKEGAGGFSPERVQLLVATVAFCFRYVTQVAHTTSGALPSVDKSWLYLFGGSSGIYAAVKTTLALRGRRAR